LVVLHLRQRETHRGEIVIWKRELELASSVSAMATAEVSSGVFVQRNRGLRNRRPFQTSEGMVMATYVDAVELTEAVRGREGDDVRGMASIEE
jgi:hypothetical protein